jgi:AcrR family transcriptional regulator
MPTSRGPVLRAVAQQRRSQVTFDAILEAAGSLFDEYGIEATTMDAIARRAGVSIGAVYRFFENRDAIVATLTARWRDCIQEAALPLFTDESLERDAADVITDFLTEFRHALTSVPGARALISGLTIEPSTQEMLVWPPHLERFLQRYAPGLRPSRRRQAAYTYQAVTSALMAGAAGAGRRITYQLDETRSVLLGYTRQLAMEAASSEPLRQAGR